MNSPNDLRGAAAGDGADDVVPVASPRLGDSREWLASLVESSNDAIVGVTLDGRIVSWNAGAERMYGWPAAEALGAHVLETVIPPDLAHETSAILLHTGEGARLESFETERLRRDGSRIAVAVTASPVRDPAGRIVGASTIARDISKRRAAEQALRENEQWARSLIASAPDAVIGMDESGALTEWNAVAEEVFGWSAREAIGQLAERLIVPPGDRDAHRRGLERYLLRDDGPMVGGRTCTNALRRNGAVFPVELTLVVHQVGGERRFTAFVQDLSYQYETETKLRQLARLVNASGDALASVRASNDEPGVVGGQSASTSDHAHSPEGQAVLVIDDEEMVRAITGRALRRWGLVPILAESGAAAIDLLRQRAEVGLVLLDLTMPGMGGAETLRAIRGLRPGIRIIVMSGHDEQDAIDQLGGAEADFIQKPYGVDDLRRRVMSALGRPAS